MCGMASFVVTKDGVFWDPDLDLHYIIEEKYNLTVYSTTIKWSAMIQLEPKYRNYKLPIEDWEYKLRHDSYPPLWYNAEESEKACRLELKKWYKEKVITEGTHTISGKVNKIILGGNVTINDLEDGSEIYVYNNSKVEINNMKSGCVSVNDKAIVNVHNQLDGCISFWDRSSGKLYDQMWGDVHFHDKSKGYIKNQKYGNVYFWGESKQLNERI